MTPTTLDSTLGGGGEFDRIRAFLAAAVEQGGERPAAVVVGPGDDCAILRDCNLALSVDLSIEDVHFRRAWLEPEDIGGRAVAVALSDLAAMAAEPLGILVSLAVPATDAGDFATRIMAGATACARRYGAVLLGGDLTKSPAGVLLDVAVVGRAGRAVLRSGARPGDSLWITGRLGGAATAVREWRAGRVPPPPAADAFRHPIPRIAEARWLAEYDVMHALIDLSDGLAGDTGHIAAASGVHIVVDADAVPIHAAASAVTGAADALALALHGGDDYEICFAAAPGAVEALATQFSDRFGVPLTRVGRVGAGTGVALRRRDGGTVPLEGGFSHFEQDTR